MKKHKKYLSDRFVRKRFCKSEKKKIIAVFFRDEISVIPTTRLYILIAFGFFVFFSKFSSLSLLRSRCVITNHSRSVITKLKISRHLIRKLASEGQLIGFKKNE